MYKTRKKIKTYGKLKRKKDKKKKKLKSYIQIMLIFENIQTRNYLHTQIKIYIIYIYIHTITQHAPVYNITANTTMTHSFRNYIQWRRSLCIYNDSKILRSLELLQLSMILKLSKTIREPHVSAWSRILLWRGFFLTCNYCNNYCSCKGRC